MTWREDAEARAAQNARDVAAATKARAALADFARNHRELELWADGLHGLLMKAHEVLDKAVEDPASRDAVAAMKQALDGYKRWKETGKMPGAPE